MRSVLKLSARAYIQMPTSTCCSGTCHPDSEMESCNIDERVPHALFVAHEPDRFGGPYGVFSASCPPCFCFDLAPNVDVLLNLPGKGYLLPALQKELRHSNIEGTGFYNVGLTSLLLCISTVVKDETEKLKCAHFFTMQIASETNGYRGAAPNSRKKLRYAVFRSSCKQQKRRA